MSTVEAKPNRVEFETEQQLVRQARAGDQDAFVQLVRLHHQTVTRRTIRFVGRADVAEDIVQEVFLTAWKSIQDFSGEADFCAWLCGIARNKAISALRSEIARRRREGNSLDGELAQWRLADAEATSTNDEEERLEMLKLCLEQLPTQHRQVIDRYYTAGDSAEQIGNDLKRKPGAVRTMLMRIRKVLQQCIQRKLKQI